MQTLRTGFSDRLFDYAQLKRDGDMAIFEQRHRQGGTLRYEVVRIRVREEERLFNGTLLPKREVYPSVGKWGTDGWTCFTLGEAEKLCQSLKSLER